MENTPEGTAGRRKSWPDNKNSDRISGAGKVKRKFLSQKLISQNKAEPSERIPLKELKEDKVQPPSVSGDIRRPFMGKSNQEIVDMITPSSGEQYYDMWKKFNKLEILGEKADKKFKSEFDKWYEKPENKIDFSEQTVSRIKEIVKSSLDESPRFSSAVRNFGFPIIVAKTEEAENSVVTQVSGNKEGIQEQEEDGVSVVSDAFTTSIAILPSAIKSVYKNGNAADMTKLTSRISMPKMGDGLIDQTINGQIRHEWSHYLIASALNNSERLSSGSKMKDKNYAKLFSIAEKYMSDSTMMGMLDKEFSETPNTPRMVTRYAHSNMFEMFAEGMSAYLHPDTTLERFVMNASLRKDIEDALGDSLEESE
jgi:hypothetical protein